MSFEWTFCRVVDGVVTYPFELKALEAEGIIICPKADPRSLAAIGVYHVHIQPRPAFVAGKVWEQDTLPALSGGFWQLGWTERDQTAEELKTEREAMVVDRLQGRLILGEVICDRLDAIATDPAEPWSLREVINGSLRWRRTSDEMMVLGHVLGYDDLQMDGLFRAAMAVEL
jgi:hypothetical protein